MTARLTRIFSIPAKKSSPKPPHQPYIGVPDIDITDADLEKAERDACTQYLLHRVQVRREREALHRWIDQGEHGQDNRESNHGFPHGLGDGPDEQERRERQETQRELKNHGFRFGFGAEGENLESPSYTEPSTAASDWTPGSRISPGNVGHPANLVEGGGSSVGYSSTSNLPRPSPVSSLSAPAPLGRVMANSSHEPSSSVTGSRIAEGNGAVLQQRDEKENMVNKQPGEFTSQATNMPVSQDVSPSSNPQTIPKSNIPNAGAVQVAAPTDSYFFQNPDPVSRPEPVPISFSGPPPERRPQRPRANTDQHSLDSPKPYHTVSEQMQTTPRGATESDELVTQAHEEQSRAKPPSDCISDQCRAGSEREAVPTTPVPSGTGSNSVGENGRVLESDAYKPKAHSAIDYKQVLRDIIVSDHSEDLKFDMAIELVGLLQKHKVRLLEEKAESEAEKQTRIDGWENYYRIRTLKANLTYLHPNDLLIQGYELLREDIPFVDFVVSQLKQGRDTTNKLRYKLQKLQKDRKLSQAPTLIGNEDSSSNGSERPRQVKESRTASQSWKSTKTWATWRKLSVGGLWSSIGRNTKARSSIIDTGVFRQDAPQSPAQQVLGSGVGTSNANALSSTRALHSSQRVPGANSNLPVNGQNARSEAPGGTAASGTSADTVDLYTNNTAQANRLGVAATEYIAREPRSSASAERLAKDGQTFAGFSAQPNPLGKPFGHSGDQM
ncbi:hypothetical protein DL95DRAFT_442163 [Leptodontidium sp. 2 PMI_412]|nr:hypothetical protein DL95DRAFT_442163 [Leptodontidium sp. 2 PMI_412]